MEENGKRRLAYALIAAAGLVYFFVCARPLPRELVLDPAWAKAVPLEGTMLSKGSPWKQGTKVHSFRFKNGFGYFDDEGTAIVSVAQPFGAAVSDASYITYEQLPESFSLRAPDGAEMRKFSESGYPFFGGERLFMVHPGQASVSELGPDGKRLWSHDFPSIITAFDSSPVMAIFGLMDGSIVGLDREGKELLNFAPGGSRIPGIYGCAVSPDGLLVAAISGLDSQRLVVLEKRSSAYRVTWHRYLSEGIRHPVSMAFTPDGRYLVFEQAGAMGVYDREARSERSLKTLALAGLGSSYQAKAILLALEGAGPARDLLCVSPAGKRLFTLPFIAEDACMKMAGNAIFIGLEASDGSRRIARLDFKEE